MEETRKILLIRETQSLMGFVYLLVYVFVCLFTSWVSTSIASKTFLSNSLSYAFSTGIPIFCFIVFSIFLSMIVLPFVTGAFIAFDSLPNPKNRRANIKLHLISDVRTATKITVINT